MSDEFTPPEPSETGKTFTTLQTLTLDVTTSQPSENSRVLTPTVDLQSPDTTTEIFTENQNFIPLGDQYEPPTPEISPEKSEIITKKNLKTSEDNSLMKKCEKCRTYFTT